MTDLHKKLVKMNACSEAVEWVGDKTLAEAWSTCERADWMLWFAERVLPRPLVVRAGCACARTALKYVPAGEDRPRLAIEAAERWAANPTDENRAASDAARDAASAAACDAAWAAACAAARAAAWAAACDAARAAASDAASDAARAAAWAAAWAAAQKDMADIVRSIIPVSAFKEESHD